jgi:xylulose-5-phosphate/fructose-6-phosphate phosphoketolase
VTAIANHPTLQAPLGETELARLDAYWRAANYLSVGQIYLLDNPLLRRPLTLEHVKPRLLGHWGTTPGLNFIYAHLNRVIKARDLNMLYVTGPGHGGPALFANTYLEGTYSEVHPDVSQDERGMRRLFKQFSFPGGVPSHVAPEDCPCDASAPDLWTQGSAAAVRAVDRPAGIPARGETGGSPTSGTGRVVDHTSPEIGPENLQFRSARDGVHD